MCQKKVKISLEWLRAFAFLDRKCFVMQDCVEALDQYANPLKRNWVSSFHQNVRKSCHLHLPKRITTTTNTTTTTTTTVYYYNLYSIQAI